MHDLCGPRVRGQLVVSEKYRPVIAMLLIVSEVPSMLVSIVDCGGGGQLLYIQRMTQ